MIPGLEDRAGHLRQPFAVASAPVASKALPHIPGAIRQPVGHLLLPRAVGQRVGAELRGLLDALTVLGTQTWWARDGEMLVPAVPAGVRTLVKQGGRPMAPIVNFPPLERAMVTA